MVRLPLSGCPRWPLRRIPLTLESDPSCAPLCSPELRPPGSGSLSACPEPPAVRLDRPGLARPGPARSPPHLAAPRSRPTPEDSLIEALVISILAVAAVVLIVMQVLYRRRVMRRRQAAGQDPVGRGTYVIFAVTAAFFLFAVFVFPLLVRGN